MKRLLFTCAATLLFAKVAMAEPATVNWTEPTASATLAYTTVYYCMGAGCTNWLSGTEFRKTSDNGNGGDAKSLTFIVPLIQDALPQTLRVRVTATDINNNETSGTIASHTFSN